MTYDEAIAFWYGRIDFERRALKPGELKLDRMRALLRGLGDPQRCLRIVHVAGTKGKGSTAAMLAAVLRRAGYRVGLFTSPHLSDVSERVQVDGVPISTPEIAARMAEIATVVRSMDASHDPQRAPTFFEIGTALGFLHFRCRRVDIAVVEVGLGGRFDSTNVCMPMVSVITNISFDHTLQLGDRLALIAREKAGIIKRRRPTIATAEAPEALAAIEKAAAERLSPLVALGRDFHFAYQPGVFDASSAEPTIVWPRMQVATARRTWPWLSLGLFGSHQAANAAGVVAAVEHLQRLGLAIDDNAVAQGLLEVSWPARLEIAGRRPLILLDCAHNVASAQALVDTVEGSFQVTGCRRLVLAVSSDKQVAEMLQALAPCFERFYLTSYGNNPRCLPPESLAELLQAVVPRRAFSVHANAAQALEAARHEAQPDDLIAITGSVFLAGELRPRLISSSG